MSDDLTDSQIALLCAIEEHDPAKSSSDEKRDLERLISGGYVQPTADHPGSAFELTAKAYRVSRRARRRAERGVAVARAIAALRDRGAAARRSRHQRARISRR